MTQEFYTDGSPSRTVVDDDDLRHGIPSASQIIAALIQRLGGGPIVLTFAETMAFGTRLPTRMESDADMLTITLTVQQD